MLKLPLPLKAVLSPKKRKSTGTSEPASKKRRLVSVTESLTGYSSYHFNRLLHQLPEHNGVKKFTSNETDPTLTVLKEVLKQGTEIRTQTQLFMVTQPLLAKVCTTVETVIPSVNLYLELEPREDIETGTSSSKPKYGDSLIMYEPQSTKLATKETFQEMVVVEEDDEDEDGEEDESGEEDAEHTEKICIMYMGAASPLVLHEVDVNVSMEKLVMKGLLGVRHLMEDFKVEKLLLLITHQSGCTKAIECCKNNVQNPPIVATSSKEFALISDAALAKPQLNMPNCMSFFNYVGECVYDLIPKKQSPLTEASGSEGSSSGASL